MDTMFCFTFMFATVGAVCSGIVTAEAVLWAARVACQVVRSNVRTVHCAVQWLFSLDVPEMLVTAAEQLRRVRAYWEKGREKRGRGGASDSARPSAAVQEPSAARGGGSGQQGRTSAPLAQRPYRLWHLNDDSAWTFLDAVSGAADAASESARTGGARPSAGPAWGRASDAATGIAPATVPATEPFPGSARANDCTAVPALPPDDNSRLEQAPATLGLDDVFALLRQLVTAVQNIERAYAQKAEAAQSARALPAKDAGEKETARHPGAPAAGAAAAAGPTADATRLGAAVCRSGGVRTAPPHTVEGRPQCREAASPIVDTKTLAQKETLDALRLDCAPEEQGRGVRQSAAPALAASAFARRPPADPRQGAAALPAAPLPALPLDSAAADRRGATASPNAGAGADAGEGGSDGDDDGDPLPPPPSSPALPATSLIPSPPHPPPSQMRCPFPVFDAHNARNDEFHLDFC